MKIIAKILCLIIVLFFIYDNYIIATDNLSQIILEVDEKNPEIDQQITLSIYVKNLSVAAGTLRIYFDSDKLELIEKPENSNVINNTILYTWFSESGKNRSDDFIIDNFVFKAKNDGVSIFSLQAELYNENGEQIQVNVQPIEIRIGEDITQIQNLEDELQNDDENNTNLAIMRLNQEGIVPVFNKNIKEYYIILPESINDLQVTAIPENKKSKVSISGNQDLINGLNTIQIKVESENRKNSSEYKIYVTKTNDINKANTNLENLAIENVTLEPDYQEHITNYTASVTNDVENLNILAIPQNQNAKVVVSGDTNLKEGNNIITATVTAENGITFKKYQITVHKMSEEESKNILSEVTRTQNSITVTDNSKEIEEKKEEQKNIQGNKYLLWIAGAIAIVMLIGIAIIVVRKRKK